LKIQGWHEEHLKRAEADEPEPFKVRVVQFNNTLLGQEHMGLNSRELKIIKKEAIFSIEKCDDLK